MGIHCDMPATGVMCILAQRNSASWFQPWEAEVCSGGGRMLRGTKRASCQRASSAPGAPTPGKPNVLRCLLLVPGSFASRERAGGSRQAGPAALPQRPGTPAWPQPCRLPPAARSDGRGPSPAPRVVTHSFTPTPFMDDLEAI
ncbi:uncharacterized protein WM294_008809 [Sarcoramphus papa]